MFYIVGLGLGDARDVTVKGLEIIKKCNRVYLECYTSILSDGQQGLEKFYGRSVIAADRELVENRADEILPVENEDVAFLTIGDPLSATTHTDLVLRARKANIKVKVIHNASILTAVGSCGLQLYSFGETVSIPFWTNNWQPDSFYEKIIGNRERNLHTLCLLDIKVKEPTLESITRKKKEYMPPKFMSVSEAVDQLLQILERKEKSEVFTECSLVIGLARIGSDDQQIVASSLKHMKKINLGEPLHSLIIPAEKLHPLEEEYLAEFMIDKE